YPEHSPEVWRAKSAVLSCIMSKAIHYTPVGIMDQGGGLILGGARSFVLIALTLVVIHPLLSIGLLSKGPVGAVCKELSRSQISNYIVAKF
ncbi:MAG TPA: hypothetical protein VHS59_08645, partial [Bacillota bacterium]|nr:hypothetical protein [Bacillota bacterium]